MPNYADTDLKKFPFVVLVKTRSLLSEDEDMHPLFLRFMDDLEFIGNDYIREDNDPEEVDLILVCECGDRLDDLR